MAIGLAKARRQARLSKYHFDRLIDARETNLRRPSFPSLDSLGTYAHGTAYSLLALQLQLLQSQEAAKKISSTSLSTLDHSLSHVGLASTLTTLLAATPHHASKRTSIFPADVAAEYGLTEEALFRQGAAAKGVKEAAAHLAAVAQGELVTARKHLEGPLDAAIAPAFLAAVRPFSLAGFFGRAADEPHRCRLSRSSIDSRRPTTMSSRPRCDKGHGHFRSRSGGMRRGGLSS